MTDSPKAVILDALTGQVIERDMTEDEIAEQSVITQESKKAQDELEAKAQSKASALAKLAALGLTEDEIAAL